MNSGFCDIFKSIILFQKKRNKHNNTARLISWSNQHIEHWACGASWAITKTSQKGGRLMCRKNQWRFLFKKENLSLIIQYYFIQFILHPCHFAAHLTFRGNWRVKLSLFIFFFQINQELIGILMGLHGFRCATVEICHMAPICLQCQLF